VSLSLTVEVVPSSCEIRPVNVPIWVEYISYILISTIEHSTNSYTVITYSPTIPPYANNLNMSRRSLSLTGPMISYCPLWLPPHQQCWYSINIDMTLPMSQHLFYMTQHDTTKYYWWQYTQYGINLPTSTTAENSYLAPPAPTASEKNLLRPP